MATEERQLQPPSSESFDAGYETSNVSIKGLAIFVACFLFVAAGIHLGAWYLLRGYVTHDQKADRPASAMTDPAMAERYKGVVTGQPEPPPPYIQPSPPQPEPRVPEADLKAMYERENAVFARLGWTPDGDSSVGMKMPRAVAEKVIESETELQKRAAQRTEGKP